MKTQLIRAAGWVLSDKEERALRALRRQPRYRPGITDLPGFAVRFVDAPSFASAYKAIFVDGIYDFPVVPERIVDGGANIGIAVLRWKQLYPDVQIDAYEPDPNVFEVLVHNTKHLDGVNCYQSALAAVNGVARFRAEGADAGQLHGAGEICVDTTRLADRLCGVDVVKLDIEGGEADVLVSCADALETVTFLFVEWHSMCGRPQRLADSVTVLERSGFRIHLQPEFSSDAPFTALRTDAGMDNRVNIFAWREGNRRAESRS